MKNYNTFIRVCLMRRHFVSKVINKSIKCKSVKAFFHKEINPQTKFEQAPTKMICKSINNPQRKILPIEMTEYI